MNWARRRLSQGKGQAVQVVWAIGPIWGRKQNALQSQLSACLLYSDTSATWDLALVLQGCTAVVVAQGHQAVCKEQSLSGP